MPGSSSGLAIPPELKRITHFLRRAEEMDRDPRPEARIVAYHCRQYAVQHGISLSGSAAARECLGGILSSLESEKKAMSVFTREECMVICQKFAFDVFRKADREDREGRATKSTAKTFYAAATFLEILSQFEEDSGEGDEEVKEKRIYSKWKSTEILKALKEGREPQPGGFGEMDAFEQAREDLQNEQQDQQQQHSDAKSTASSQVPNSPIAAKSLSPKAAINVREDCDDDAREEEKSPETRRPKINIAPLPPTLQGDPSRDEEGTEVDLHLGPPPPAYPTLPPISPPRDSNEDDFDDIPPQVHAPPLRGRGKSLSPKRPSATKGKGFFSALSLSPSSRSVQSNGHGTSKEALEDATELARFALSALEDRDVELGRKRLKEALKCLGR